MTESSRARHQQRAAEILRSRFDCTDTHVHETWGSTVVVEAKTALGDVFLKATSDRSVRVEALVLRAVRGGGVPVPEILDHGEDSGLPGGHWILMARVPGETWNPTGLPEPATSVTIDDMARYLARLHSLRLPGYGWVGKDGSGTSPTWSSWVRSEVAESATVLGSHGWLSTSFQAKADRTICTVVPDEVPHSILNADLGLAEMLVDPDTGSVTGILDWGAAAIGDPLYDLATFAFGGPATDPLPRLLQPRIFDAYAAHVPTVGDCSERLLALYRMLNHLSNACWSIAEGVDSWTKDLCDEATRLLEYATNG